MKSVYLFELDSVKNRDEQVIKAQRALFDEIVCNGNCVVLSLNQLVDSRMIMSMLNSEEYYDVLDYLFCNGYLKYSQYNDIHTPSQYLQKTIEDNRSFIYSALPVKSNQKYLLHLIYEALRNDDLSIIRSKIEKQKKEEKVLDIFDEWIDGKHKKNNLTKEQAVSILEYIKRFLELIIKISIEYSAHSEPLCPQLRAT